MRVVAWGGGGSRARAAGDGVEVAASKVALFERADVPSVHLWLVDATRGIVGQEDLALLGGGSV